MAKKIHLLTMEENRTVYEGLLQKRCRLCWRPRYVELLSDPVDCTGPQYSFQLLIYDPRKEMLKDRIRVENIVTVRASRDCYFQIYLSSGKILQFKSDTIDSQVSWMALLKVSLGRGSIFHVRVNTPKHNLDHALLYSIGVNLPAHRVGQLDRVIVLSSPVNDINLQAWDLNRVKRFIELDIGIRMELCRSCTQKQFGSPTVTFIVEKRFIKDCMSFLCREAKISEVAVEDNGLLIYPVPHQCNRISAHPPPYSATAEPVEPTDATTASTPPKVPPHPAPKPVRPAPPPPHPPRLPAKTKSFKADMAFSFTDSDWGNGDSGSGSVSVRVSSGTDSESDDDSYLPPRTIPRRNYECSLPASAQPYLNFQPYLFSGRGRFDSPFQISSRIIITDKGEVQYERNILGSTPQSHGAFHFMQEMPVPPRQRGPSVKPKPTTNPSASARTLDETAEQGLSSTISEPTLLESAKQHSPKLSRRSSDPTVSQAETNGNTLKRSSEVSVFEGEYVIPTSNSSSPVARSRSQTTHTLFETTEESSPSLADSRQRSKSEFCDQYDVIQLNYCRNHANSEPSAGPPPPSPVPLPRHNPLSPLAPATPPSPLPRSNKPPIAPRKSLRSAGSTDSDPSPQSPWHSDLSSPLGASWPDSSFSNTLQHRHIHHPQGLSEVNKTLTLTRMDTRSNTSTSNGSVQRPIPKPRSKTVRVKNGATDSNELQFGVDITALCTLSPPTTKTEHKVYKSRLHSCSNCQWQSGLGESEML